MANSSGALPPLEVAERLQALRLLYVAERDDEARARLARERPVRHQPFDVAVAERLRELRALSALAHHLHQARVADSLKGVVAPPVDGVAVLLRAPR